ncbi:MAG: DUF2099 family protein [Thermoplasmata archaeon]|jgi:putative methanogenesis marker protein 8|nr:DUF2099 family protein [Thermoplasmata archaeon]
MSKHVMECLGLSRVTIEDGKVVEVTEPKVKYCPLFEKTHGVKELNKEFVKENMEFRMNKFGMCCENRQTEMDNFLSFGISELLCLALKNQKIEAAVIAADGCGTAVIRKPSIVQGMGGRISGICETEPIPKVIEAIGPENVVDPDTAKIDMIEGVCKAYDKGLHKIAVTTTSVQDAWMMRDMFGTDLTIIGVHTSGMSEKDAEDAFELFDIITACASKYVREVYHRNPEKYLAAGNKVPVYGITDFGKELITDKLKELGKEPFDPSTPEQPPYPLI